MRALVRKARATKAARWQRRLAAESREAAVVARLCENVLEWAVARDPTTEWKQLLPPRAHTLAPPHTVEAGVLAEYTTRLTRHQRGNYLVRIDGASLIGQHGLVMLPDGSFAVESVYTPEDVRKNPHIGLAALRAPVRKPGAYVSLLVGWACDGNYYHWFHDTVKRLGGVFSLLPRGTRFIVPSPLLEFQREALELVGIAADQLEPFGPQDYWQLEQLYFVSPATNSGSHRADADVWLRDTLLARSGVSLGKPTRRLYLSRRDAPTRQVTNEAEVIGYLDDFGFEVCELAELSIREKAALFARAEAVVSAHGAGLTSIMFAPPGLRVLDVLPPQLVSNAYAYWTLAHELEHEYWYCLGAAAPDGSNDMTIPLDKLAATIERWGLTR